VIDVLARETTIFTDDVWLADATPIECARSWESVRRSELAGHAEHRYCPAHTRYFWG